MWGFIGLPGIETDVPQGQRPRFYAHLRHG
jgi:hypothetical protein